MNTRRRTISLPDQEISYSAALNEALRGEMARDPSVFVMGEDIARWGDRGGVFGVTRGLFDEFGGTRVRDTPISEEGIVALGVGAAMTGTRPVVELMYSDFLTLAMDPLVNQAAKIRYMFGGQAHVPLVVRTNGGASGGKAAQHSQSLESLLYHVPGLKIAVPAIASDAKGLLITAIRDDNPVIFLEHKNLYFVKGLVPEEHLPTPFGHARVVRDGSHLTVVATQTMVYAAIRAAEVLAEDGFELEVIDPRTLVPFDLETVIASVRKTNRLLVCHEAAQRGGWAGDVIADVISEAFDYLDAPPMRVGSKNLPVPYSEPLENYVIANDDDIIAAARLALAGSDRSILDSGLLEPGT